MTLAPGSRLGPYEILAPLGAGGMGEVYRARDPRLGREVAIKVLPASFSADPDRLRRFELEARAAGVLNHPNITAVYDVGEQGGVPYVVEELLEGGTLREVLSGGALAARKAIDWASQIARGLAAAHEKGIVHRDLKPANLFVTKSGRVKILDFGLAKLTQPDAARSPLTEASTVAVGTEPGVILGTVGYLSPEQVRGLPADARSDIFAFGVVLYEMLTGERAFRGESGIEILNAILKDEPPDLSRSGRGVPPGLELVVRHCFEKRPEERFQSAQDIAFSLDALSGVSGSRPAAISRGPVARRRWLASLAAVALVLAGAIGAWFLASRKSAGSSSPSFHQLTFRDGTIVSAKFAPDGQTIVYSAAWGSGPYEVFSTRPESPESRSLGLPPAVLLGISGGADLALKLLPPGRLAAVGGGTLAQAPLGGGSPREILEDVSDAAWERDGKQFVVQRSVAGRDRLEGPPGKILYETDGAIWEPRISPVGDWIAFLDYVQAGNSAGAVAVVDRSGKKRRLTEELANVYGLAWGPSGDELWFGSSAAMGYTDLMAVNLSGRQRLLMRSPGELNIQDVFRDGRALLISYQGSSRMMYGASGDARERNLSWLEWSEPTDISPDGKLLLFMDGAAGKDFLIYTRTTDGSPAIRIGEGLPCGFSPDGKWVLAIPVASPSQIVLLPTGPGARRQLTRDSINHTFARWMPGGNRIVFVGSEPGHQARLFVQEVSGGGPRAISAEGLVQSGSRLAVSPDGKLVAALGIDRRIWLYPVDGGQPAGLPGGAAGALPIQWSADGRFLYVFESEQQLPGRIFRVEIRDGRRELWKEIMPSDPTGVHAILDVQVSPDGQSYAYSYFLSLGTLYLVEGLK